MSLDQWKMQVVGVLAESLVYNPFTNLYLYPSHGHSVGFARAGGYINLPHQVALYTRYLSVHPLRLFIADEIGLGKTVEALRFVKYAWSILGLRRILIVVPPNLVEQWVNGDARGLGIDARVLDPRAIQDLARMDPSIVRGVYVGSMDTLKLSRGKTRHFDVVSTIPWDLVIVDEAHKLGITPGGRETLRFKHIGRLCRAARHCILLSATPTRGYARDLLARLSLIDPGIDYSRKAASLVDRLDQRSLETLKALRGAYIVRRGKEHLRHLDDPLSRIPDARFHLFMVKPTTEEARLYQLVYQWTVTVLRELGAGPEVGLLRAILVKRALSSPISLARTLHRILEGRTKPSLEAANRAITALEDYMDGEGEPQGEEALEADEYEEALLSLHLEGLSEASRIRVGEMLSLANQIAGKGDSTLKMLAGMLAAIASTRDPLIPGEEDTARPNMLVFTEYKDTLYYIQSTIPRLLANHGVKEAPPQQVVNVVSHLLHAGEDEARRIAGYTRYYHAGKGRLLLVYLSSDNTWMIPAAKGLIDATADSPYIKTVVITTDVAGEGLNLQGANVLVNYEVPWSMIKREQRIGRVWRIGQRRRVHIIDVVRATELEAETYKRLLSKIYFLNLTMGTARAPAMQDLEIYQLEPDRDKAPIPLAVRPREASEYHLLQELADTLEKTDATSIKLELERLASKIRAHIERYRYIAEALAGSKPWEEARDMLESIYRVYGASTHQDALESVGELVELLGRSRSDRLDNMLITVEKAINTGAKTEGPLFFIAPINQDPRVAAALLYTVEYMIDTGSGEATVYKLPILVKVEHTPQGYTPSQTLPGLAAIREAASLLKRASPLGSYMIAELGRPEEDEIVSAALRGAQETARDALEEIRRAARPLITSEEKLARLGILDRRAYDKYKPSLPYMAGKPRLLAVVYNTSHTPPREPSMEKRCMVQDEAENYVKKLFEEKGFHVEDPLDPCPSQGRTPYDLLATPKGSLLGEEYYIEVKGHEGLVLIGELSERETRFAREHPDRYIICIVTMALSRDKKVFCNPYSKWPRRVKTSEREIVYVAGQG